MLQGALGVVKKATGAVTGGQNGEEKKTAPFLFPRSYQLILCVGHVSYTMVSGVNIVSSALSWG